jgi:hypothetical protein
VDAILNTPFQEIIGFVADPSGRAVEGMGVRPLAYCDYGFESRLGHGCLSVVSVVCCQVEVFATGWSLVQRSPTEFGVSKKCVIVKPRKMRRSRPPRSCRAIKKIGFVTYFNITVFYFVAVVLKSPTHLLLPKFYLCMI